MASLVHWNALERCIWSLNISRAPPHAVQTLGRIQSCFLQEGRVQERRLGKRGDWADIVRGVTWTVRQVLIYRFTGGRAEWQRVIVEGLMGLMKLGSSLKYESNRWQKENIRDNHVDKKCRNRKEDGFRANALVTVLRHAEKSQKPGAGRPCSRVGNYVRERDLKVICKAVGSCLL